MTGETIAHYRITSKLGEGGMGAVYRATDTKLGRDVAIKVIPESFAQDPERMARFTREAQVLASLNHPNIAAIYGVEERALVMELVEGQTLAQRIEGGAMPPLEAAAIARQIAEALEAAHEQGVVHRDLKPANVKVTPEGIVKVLDFGLAKAMEEKGGAGSNPGSSPTLTIRATQLGMIMGTAAYMSPEQASGRPVDKRADVWSYGTVFWEMLAGSRLFDGETISDTLADVLRRELDFDKLPQGTPAVMRDLLKRCLERDVKSRLRDIGEARIALRKYLADPADVKAPAATVVRRSIVPWAALVALLAAALAITGVFWWRATRPVSRPLMRLSVDLGPDALYGGKITAAISPDGTRIVFPAKGSDGRQQLATRQLGQSKAVLLPGTENGFDPFFSPDGQWIGFFSGGKMRKTAAQGGAPVTLCDVSEPRGAAWGEDDTIIFAATSSSGLVSMPASGGKPQPLTKLTGTTDRTHRWPQILPGGEAVLFTASETTGQFEEAHIDVLFLKTGQRKTVVSGGYYGRYLPGGHLLYVHQGTVFEVRIDPARMDTRGTPAPVLEDVISSPTFGAGQFDFSLTGTFVYFSGKQSGQMLTWVDATGKLEPLLRNPAGYVTPRLSPDGKRLAMGGSPAAPRDLWVYDWQRDTPSRLTFDEKTSRYPVWTPDGKHIVYGTTTGAGIWWVRSDGGGEPRRLLEGNGLVLPSSFSPDGRRLAYSNLSAETGYDIWILPLDISDAEHPTAGKPEVFLRTPANERLPVISPDGRWLAYASNESGSYEVLVRPFPGPGGKWQVSTGGGNFPIWSRDGRQLFYVNPDYQIMVATAASKGDSFNAVKPRLWSDRRVYAQTILFPNLDIAPDGKRFVVTMSPEIEGENKSSVHVTFLLNFFDELARRAK